MAIATKLTGKELLRAGTATVKKRFDQWRQDRNIDDILAYGTQYRGWNVTPQKLGKLFLSEQKRHAEGWYASFADAYDRTMLGHDACLPEPPSLDDRFTEALAALRVDPWVGSGKIMQLVEDGYVPAMAVAADMYATGYYLQLDYAKAFELACKAHESGSDKVDGLLAYLYATGKGVEADLEKSRQHFLVALDADVKENLRWIGLCYYEGWPMGENPRLCIAYLQEACEHGDVVAGVMLFTLIVRDKLPVQGLDPDHWLRVSGASDLPIGLTAMALADLADINAGIYSQEASEILVPWAAACLHKAADRHLLWAEDAFELDPPIFMPNGDVWRLSRYGLPARGREIAVASLQHLDDSISNKN